MLPYPSCALTQSKLRLNDCCRQIAMERCDFAVLNAEDIAARGMNFFAGGWNSSGGRHEIALVSAVQRQFNDHHVIVEIERVELPVNVGKRFGVDIDGHT